jgi:hypothetical protein
MWRWTNVLQIRLYDEDSVEHPVYFTNTGEAVGLTPEEAKKNEADRALTTPDCT